MLTVLTWKCERLHSDDFSPQDLGAQQLLNPKASVVSFLGVCWFRTALRLGLRQVFGHPAFLHPSSTPKKRTLERLPARAEMSAKNRSSATERLVRHDETETSILPPVLVQIWEK